MKKLCAIVLACLLALPSQAAVAIAGSGTQIFTGTAASGTSCSVTVSGLTAGNLLYLAMAWTAPSVTVNSANDGLGHNFTQIDATTGGSFAASYHGYLNNISSSITSVGITSSGSVSCAAIVVEFTGQNTSSPIGGTAKGCYTANASDHAIPTSGGLSAGGSANDYIVSVSGNFNYPASNWYAGGTGAPASPYPPSGYAVQKVNNQTTGNGTAHTAVAGAGLSGSYSTDLSLDPGVSVSANGCTMAVVIKAAAGGATTPVINKRKKLDKFDLAALMRWEMDRWR